MGIEVQGNNGVLRLDGAFVEIERARRARGVHRVGTKRLALSAISGVQLTPPTLMAKGVIQFIIHGQEARSDQRGTGLTSAVQDENSVLFGKPDLPAFEAFRSAVEQAMSGGAVASPGIADHLAKLADLHAAGVLTASEFDAAKQRLLAP